MEILKHYLQHLPDSGPVLTFFYSYMYVARNILRIVSMLRVVRDDILYQITGVVITNLISSILLFFTVFASV